MIDLKGMPDHWREKIEGFETAAYEAQIVSISLGEKYREIHEKLSRLKGLQQPSHLMTNTERMLQKAQMPPDLAGEIAELERQKQRIGAQRDEKSTRSSSLRAISEGIQALFKIRPASAYEDCEAVADIQDGETPLQGVHRLRRRLNELNEKRNEIESAHLGKDDLKALVPAIVHQMADKGRPRVHGMDTGDLSFTWMGAGPHRTRVFSEFNATGCPAHFMAWFDPKRLIAKMQAEIDDLHPGGLTMSRTEQRQALAVIADEQLETERAEEALIVRCLANGFAVDRRTDANPLAILGIRLKQRPIKEAA